MFVLNIMTSNDFGMGGCEASVPDAAGPSQVEVFSLCNGRSRGCGWLFHTVDEMNPTSVDMKNMPLPLFTGLQSSPVGFLDFSHQ